jgi:signal transduction histidine kinase/ligand-binding sensor domain-containing protein
MTYSILLAHRARHGPAEPTIPGMSPPSSLPLLRRVLVAVSCALAASAHAIDPGVAPWHYAHTAWRIQDGELPDIPQVIAESRDGYLWIGTNSGPFRFDGKTFRPVQAGDGPADLLAGEPIYDILPASDGSLWLGGEHGAWRWRPGQIKRFEDQARVNAFREDARHRVWFSRSRDVRKAGPLARVDGDVRRDFGPADGLTVPGAAAFAIAPDGTAWIAVPDGVLHWDGRAGQVLEVSAPTKARSQIWPGALEITRDGTVYVGYQVDDAGFGLQRVAGDRLVPVPLQEAGKAPHVSALLLDRQGTLWIGTLDDGLFRLRAGRTDHFSTGDGLSGKAVRSLFEDREGNLWVGTSAGLDRLRDLRVDSLTLRDGLSADEAQALAPSPDGSLWVSDSLAVDQIRDGHVAARLKVGATSGGGAFTKVFVDRSGRLWAGIDDDLAVWADGRFKRIRMPDGQPVGMVLDIAQDGDGAVWATTVPALRRLVRVEGGRVTVELPGHKPYRRLAIGRDGRLWAASSDSLWRFAAKAPPQEFPFPPSAGRMRVRGLQPGPGDAMMVATDKGVVVWREGRMRRMDLASGLPCDNVFGVTVDRRSDVWVYASCGLVRVPSRELEAWWRGPGTLVHPTLFDATDGALPAETVFGNSGAMDGAGRVWFVNDSRLQGVYPDRLRAPGPSPPVFVEAIKVGEESYPVRGPLHFRSNPPVLEIDYTAVNLTAAQKIRFRYRLEGHDAGWQDAGTRRQALYTDLKPGHYRFHVIASSPDGVWNEQGAAIELDVPPTFFQSNWFVALCLLASALLLWLVDRLRQRHLHLLLQAQLAERTRIAGELHDTLLQGAQGLILTLQTHVGHPHLPDRDRSALDQAILRASELVGESRDRIQDLRAPSRPAADLFRILKTEGEMLSANTGTRFAAVMRGPDRDVRTTVRDDLRRLATEAMGNAFRHAAAGTVSLELALDDHGLELAVTDDGIGLDPERQRAAIAAGHWGITGMRERARRMGARLAISGKPGLGTQVRLVLPAQRVYPPPRRRTWASSLLGRRARD